MNTMTSVSAERLAELEAAGGVDLIDVRTPLEYRDSHIPMARNVPLDTLDPRRVVEERNGSADRPLYVICTRGNRSTRACQQFLDAGYTNVVNVEGGTEAWIGAGLPVVHGKPVVSLERQVRIAAGALVLAGAVLAMVVHPYFAGISAFIGAGLLFSGITNTCGMAMLLVRMPWNGVSNECSKAAPVCSR